MRLADIFNEDIRKNLLLPKQYKSIFPSTEKIYDKQIVIENDPVLKYTSKRYSLEENCNNPKNKNLYRDNNTKIKKQYADDYNSYYNGYQNYENEYNNNYNCEDNDCEYEYVLVRENKKSLYNHKKKTNYKLHTSNKKEKFSYTKKKSNGLTVNTLNSPNKLEGDSNKEISNNHILNKEMPNENKSEPKKIYDDYENKSGDNSTSSNTDDCKIKINLDITNSPESVCSLKNNANNINIYRKRENSRFGFVNKIERNNSDNVCNILEIPDYVSDILYKKISSYTFFKKFTCVNDVTKDIMNFEKVLNKYKNDSWVQFIKSNVSIVKKC